MSDLKYFAVCNDTKWLELRACVLSFEIEQRPEFRSKSLSNGHISAWDKEWFYHFNNGGFDDIEWFELGRKHLDNNEMISGILKIGLVGERLENALRVYGHVPHGYASRKLAPEDFGEDQTQHNI